MTPPWLTGPESPSRSLLAGMEWASLSNSKRGYTNGLERGSATPAFLETVRYEFSCSRRNAGPPARKG